MKALDPGATTGYICGAMVRPSFHALLMAAGLAVAVFLGACATTHPLPTFERPLARNEYQQIRTTAYTHTEADHLEYGNHNALGGTLHAATVPWRPAGTPVLAVSPEATSIVSDEGGFHHEAPPTRAPTAFAPSTPLVYGSAAADWSRWPAGTVFRIESTGQVYRVDDYGWALAGRNTIDLYESSARAMNEWGVRRELIHVLSWGDRAESLRLLRRHQGYRHIRRMVLELEGREQAAADLD